MIRQQVSVLPPLLAPTPRARRRPPKMALLVWMTVIGCFSLTGAERVAAQDRPTVQDDAKESSDVAMAKYADAANFQTGGAFDVAIEAWNKFLAEYPKHPMASQAAHYLGVCHMQKEDPNYATAAKSFDLALQNKDYDLRQESLANLGWCLYASAGEGEQRNTDLLKKSISAFTTLEDESPNSAFLDRAHFYRGEASYGLGDAKQAIVFYDKLLSMPAANESPLRCDALYGRGVAHEELNNSDAALASYRQLLGSCQRAELVTDVHLRVGDMLIMQKEYEPAIKAFSDAFESTSSTEDRAYAMFRQAFALVQADRPAEAAAKYELLLADFPQSPFAGAAMLASAQSRYRSGDLEGAAEGFRKVLGQNSNLEASTEAAHWLARIEINRGRPDEAAKLVRKQLELGIDGDFAMDLRLDLAEALSMDPQKAEESLKLFIQAYRDAPDDRLAPRALYNAAFSSLQLDKPKQAIELAEEFTSKFPQDTLLPDVKFVAAESQLLNGNPGAASDTYRELLASTSRDNPQRPLWLLRAAATGNSAGRFESTVDMLTAGMNLFQQPIQKAEAYLLVGQAQLGNGQPEAAVTTLIAAQKAAPSWNRANEAKYVEGQALLQAGKSSAAKTAWQELVAAENNSPRADQARYQLAQLASEEEDYPKAIRYYDQILDSENQSGLITYAEYGKGWALMQLKQYKAALTPLENVLNRPEHPLFEDARLARGIALRNLKQYEAARNDLEAYLEIPPTGINLGHALYELSLIDQTSEQPDKAAEKLVRLVNRVPDYPSMDRVLYELGWSLQETGKTQDAMEYFTKLIQQYPDADLVADAAYFIGQQHYGAEAWAPAAEHFNIAAVKANESSLSEKAHYRLGWSQFKQEDYLKAEQAFADQAEKHRDGKLSLDALMMIGECRFKRGDFQQALEGFQVGRDEIRKRDETSKTIRDEAERRVRELVFLHGGQSASQLKDWETAIAWYDELRQRFPTTQYRPQLSYETGLAHQQVGHNEEALKYFQDVADNYRNELAARSRFMMGEIFFENREFDRAIPEFQRVMYGFGAEKATDAIKNWQAKSGFEAGRCCELLSQTAKTEASKQKAAAIGNRFFNYVIENHPSHELVAKSRQRIEALRK